MHSLDTEKPYHQNAFDQAIEPFTPYFIEFVGTMLLVFIVGTTSVLSTNGPTVVKEMGALAIGFGLVVLVFLGGHISGAHYNPAVTTSILLTMRYDKTKITVLKSIVYVLVQVMGSICGALLVYVCTQQTFGPQVNPQYGLVAGITAEVVSTFLLVTVVLNVATTDAQENNSFFGLAIGLTVASMAIAVGGISGGAFNPAVGTGPHLVSLMLGNPIYPNMWIYWVGPLLGAAIGAGFFRITNVQEYKSRWNREHVVNPSTLGVVDWATPSNQMFNTQ